MTYGIFTMVKSGGKGLGQTVDKPQELSGKICTRDVLREIRLSRGGQPLGNV